MQHDLDITGMTADGAGVARREGKVVFVPGALVGERVRVEIVPSGTRVDRGHLIEVLVPAGRQPTPCQHDHAAGCGGCSLLFASRTAQAEAKRLIVTDALERLAHQPPAVVGKTRTPGPDLGYRNHARFGVDRDGRLTFVARATPGGRGMERDSVAITTCVVLDPRLDRVREALSGNVVGPHEVELRLGARTGETLIVLRGASGLPPGIDPTRFTASIALEKEGRFVPIRGYPWIHEDVLGARFRISANSFFQVNSDGAELIATLVREAANASPQTRALDLFCGVGLFAVAALGAAARVVGVEIEETACADFRVNTSALPHVRLRPEPVVDVLRDLRPGRDVFDVAVINPPRAGIGQDAIRALGPVRIPRLVVVSCDPGSLARDVVALAREGYLLRSVTPVDQFPGTTHVETVSVLELQ